MRLKFGQCVLAFFLFSGALMGANQDMPQTDYEFVERLSMHELAEQHVAGIYAKQYPGSDHLVVQNVGYMRKSGKKPGRVIGQIDLLVLDGDEVIEVAQVKYANTNIAKVQKKAAEQIQRFLLECGKKECLFLKDRELLGFKVREEQALKTGYYMYQGEDEWSLEGAYHRY